MGFIDKIKNVFWEEVEIDDEEETVVAKKVDVPKKSVIKREAWCGYRSDEKLSDFSVRWE